MSETVDERKLSRDIEPRNRNDTDRDRDQTSLKHRDLFRPCKLFAEKCEQVVSDQTRERDHDPEASPTAIESQDQSRTEEREDERRDREHDPSLPEDLRFRPLASLLLSGIFRQLRQTELFRCQVGAAQSLDQ